MKKKLIKGISLLVCLGILLSFASILKASPRVDNGEFEMQWRAFLKALSWFFIPNSWFTFDNPDSKSSKSPFSYNYPATKTMKLAGDTPSDDPIGPGEPPTSSGGENK